MTTEEAILWLRKDPGSADLVRSSYLDAESADAAERFRTSAEFKETLRIVSGAGCLGRVVDLGAGTGMASVAFADSGATSVVAVEPDLSDVIGLGCLARSTGDRPIERVSAFGDGIPLESNSVDLVFCRQVLHHIPDLPATLMECARILRPGGMFLATREHVVDDEAQLEQFQAEHPVHQLAGGENAYSLDAYVDAMTGSGLVLDEVLASWDSIVNAFPDVERTEDLARAPAILLQRRFGRSGYLVGSLPGVRTVLWRRLRRPRPGRLYSFVARKPDGRRTTVGPAHS
jgi:SAM-dependent methyltransferase